MQDAKGLSGNETVSGLLPMSSGHLERASQRSAPCLSIVVKRDLRCPCGACSNSLLLGRGRTLDSPQPCAMVRRWGGPQNIFQFLSVEHNSGRKARDWSCKVVSSLSARFGRGGWTNFTFSPASWVVLNHALFTLMCADH